MAILFYKNQTFWGMDGAWRAQTLLITKEAPILANVQAIVTLPERAMCVLRTIGLWPMRDVAPEPAPKALRGAA